MRTGKGMQRGLTSVQDATGEMFPPGIIPGFFSIHSRRMCGTTHGFPLANLSRRMRLSSFGVSGFLVVFSLFYFLKFIAIAIYEESKEN